MDDISRIAGIVQSIGFQCTQCGTCCSPVEVDSNLVIVTPEEIRQIMKSSGLSWQEIAEPYPETIEDTNDRSFTIGWCIRRNYGSCWFLEDSSCCIYENRPWICKTYPFALAGDNVQTFPCPGIGREIPWEHAMVIAQNLLDRRNAEINDEGQVRCVLKNCTIPSGEFVVIDSDGVKKIPR